MRQAPQTALVLVFTLFANGLSAGPPNVDRIDYRNPKQYLAFPDSLGNRAAILKQASMLKGSSDTETIHTVLAWMDQTLKYEDRRPYRWRNYDDLVREHIYCGCADQGIVCGVLLKGAGIPAVWVKTMDVDWIWDFKKGRPFEAWSGHVFLEVFVNGKWCLLNPGGNNLYQDYSPKMRILPGRRFAYDKGNDPEAMIMSSQWEPWKTQTAEYFRQLDETLLPVDERGGTSLVRKAYVVANSPFYQALTAMAAESRLHVARSFNTDYDKYLPESKGNVLLIEVHKGKPIIPSAVLERYYPTALAGISRPTKLSRINGTVILFVDFSEPLRALGNIDSSETATAPATLDSK